MKVDATKVKTEEIQVEIDPVQILLRLKLEWCQWNEFDRYTPLEGHDAKNINYCFDEIIREVEAMKSDGTV